MTINSSTTGRRHLNYLQLLQVEYVIETLINTKLSIYFASDFFIRKSRCNQTAFDRSKNEAYFIFLQINRRSIQTA